MRIKLFFFLLYLQEKRISLENTIYFVSTTGAVPPAATAASAVEFTAAVETLPMTPIMMTTRISPIINGKSTNTHAKVTYPLEHNTCNNQSHPKENTVFNTRPSVVFKKMQPIIDKIMNTK